MSALTKKALEASLKRLLHKKPLNKITINEIADDCGISRMTFYYHFRDIYDLVEWSLDEDATEAMEGKMTYESWDQGFLRILKAIGNSQEVVVTAYYAISREQMEKFLHRITYNSIIGVINEKAEGMEVSEEDRRFIADFYKYAFVGVTMDWIGSGMKEAPEAIVRRVRLLIGGGVVRALEHYSTEAEDY